jgi:hypothetical protein
VSIDYTPFHIRLTIDRTNTQNDALLHRLVHTQLLSGSLNQELNLTSAQRKKALEGRILELAGTSKLGQGEKTVRAKERNKASKRVREGMLEKQKQRREKLVQEVIVFTYVQRVFSPKCTGKGYG